MAGTSVRLDALLVLGEPIYDARHRSKVIVDVAIVAPKIAVPANPRKVGLLNCFLY